MSRFLTTAEFITRVGEDEALQIAGAGFDNSEAGRTIDAAKIETAIRFADDLISGYVLGRHPWLADAAQVPDLLKGIASDITRYRLRDEAINRSLITETVATRYRDALTVLRDIQKGAMALAGGGASDQQSSAEAAGGVQISGGAGRANQVLQGWLQ